MFVRGESQGWLNENLQNTSLSKDGRVSCLSDTGFVSLPELTGGNGDSGRRASAELRFLLCGVEVVGPSRSGPDEISGAGNSDESAYSGGVDP